MTTCLIVLHETLGGEELKAEVQRRMEDGCTFRLLVPAVGAGEEHGVAAAGPISSAPAAAKAGQEPATPAISVDQARDWANEILREAWTQLEDQLGADIEEAEVGDPDPMAAMQRVIDEHAVDELIIATPPQQLARLVSMDVPSKAERRFSVPITAITAEPTPPSRAA